MTGNDMKDREDAPSARFALYHAVAEKTCWLKGLV